MRYIVKILWWLFIFSRQESETGIEVTKFLYPQDLSEHCRRRVLPSVFLGRHVADAYSKVLHFEKIDLPYSCFISIRAETGNNIILVLQLVRDTSHMKPCQENSNQMLVYAMAETFGGYWGSLPETDMRSRPRINRMYTLNTSAQFRIRAVPTETTSVEEETTTPQPSESHEITEQQDLIELNIPLANVSVMVKPKANHQEKFGVFMNEDLDFLYDVMPRENISYQTSILPLAQISMINQKSENQDSTLNKTSRYQLEYNFALTPDIRLTYPRVRGVTPRRILFRKHTYANKLRKPFKGQQRFLPIRDKASQIKRLKSSLRRHSKTDRTAAAVPNNWKVPSSNNLELITTKTQIEDHTDTEVKSISELLKELKESINYSHTSNENTGTNITALLEELSNTGYNGSAYLYPDFQNNNLRRKNINTLELTTSDKNHSFVDSSVTFMAKSETLNTTLEKLNTKHVTTKSDKMEVTLINLDSSAVTHKSGKIVYDDQITVTERNSLQTANDNEKQIIMKLATSASVSWPPHSGSLVDRESFENVVQVAPAIAGLLNQSAKDTDATFAQQNVLNSTESVREKRHLHAIPIYNAKPRTMTTEETTPTTLSTTFNIGDIQDFFGLVELSDDELHGRVALKHLRQYLGPSVFNICEFTEPKERRVVLFNSSRIVIALTNFTIEKLTIVLTPGRTLLTSEHRCPSSNIECQVSGARVCINSMTACDGVPNCGAYDIFDEDRLMCGAAVGLQHNVWLAAVTFLAVMLTVLYTVHYWLTRCVPKVSEAFFIYSDGDENTLYLESIMRSPNDEFNGPMDVTLLEEEIVYTNEKNRSWFAIFCNKLKKNKTQEDDNSAQRVKRMFSFTQTEIRKIATNNFTNVSVQTGESLEMRDLRTEKEVNLEKNKFKTKNVTDTRKQSSMFNRSMTKYDIPSLESVNSAYELSLIKLFKDSTELDSSESKEAVLSLTLGSNSDHSLQSIDERELKSHVYDRTQNLSVIPTTSSVHDVTTNPEIHSEFTSQTQWKRLRFIDEPVAVHAIIDEESDEQDVDHIVDIGFRHRPNQEARIDRQDTGQPSMSRDFKRFFTGGKGKKSKNKKSQIQLR